MPRAQGIQKPPLIFHGRSSRMLIETRARSDRAKKRRRNLQRIRMIFLVRLLKRSKAIGTSLLEAAPLVKKPGLT